MKRLISFSLVFTLLMTMFMFTNTVLAEQDEGFTFTVSNNVAEITGYEDHVENVTIPSTLGGYTVTSIGNLAFYDCFSIKTINLPKSITRIGNGAFENCSSLKYITIPEIVTSIGDYSFAECWELSAAYFLCDAPQMGMNVFSNCAETFSVYYKNGKTGYNPEWNGYKTVGIDVIPPVISVKINKSIVYLKIFQTTQLAANIFPSNAENKSVTWTSSNPKIASVSSKGKVTAKNGGSSIITVKTVNNGKKAMCKVIVDNKRPYSVQCSPKNNQTGISTKVNISIKFNENIYKGKYFSKIKLTKSNRLIGIVRNISKNYLTIKIKSSLLNSSNYVLTIPSNSIKDKVGNSMKKSITLKFVTKPKPPYYWQNVVSFSGKTSKNTQKFTIKANEWRVIWSAYPSDEWGGNFAVWLIDSGGNYEDLIANVIDEGNEVTYEYGSGTYYFNILASVNYKIQVQQKIKNY